SIQDLNTQIPDNPGFIVLESATGISRGQIVGQGQFPGGARHGFLLTPTGAKALTAAANAATSATETLSPHKVTHILTKAAACRQIAGVDSSSLKYIHVHTADLSGNTLGQVVGNTVWLDQDAAGWGSFWNKRPADDSDFAMPGDQGEQRRMDLSTVLNYLL